MDRPAKPTKQKKSSFFKFIEVTHSQKSGRGSGVINILLELFYFKIPDLVQRHTAAAVAAKNCR